MKAKLDITKRSDGLMYINVEDEQAHIQILSVKITLEQLMQALTGLAARPAEITRLISIHNFKKLGKTCETKSIFIEKPPAYNKDEQSVWVVQKIAEIPEYDGWEIFSNGINTQQNGDKHAVIMRRWV